MLRQPPVPVLRALVQLRAIPAWDVILDMLAAEQAHTLDLLMERQDDAAIRQLQGRARLLKEIRQLAADAPELLAKATGGR